MNIDTFYFKKDIVKTAKSFNGLEKVILNHKPTKKKKFRSIKHST